MRRALVPALSLFLIACANDTERTEGEPPLPTDTTAMAPAPDASAATGIAGSWNMRIMSPAGDSVMGEYVLNAAAGDSGWVLNFPNQEPVPARVVSSSPDSTVIEAGPYPSVLRGGIPVRTHTVLTLAGDSLHARAIARYETTTADSVANVHSVGTRAP
jgi:hypothetical protein